MKWASTATDYSLIVAGGAVRREEVGFFLESGSLVIVAMHADAVGAVALETGPLLVVRNAVGQGVGLADVEEGMRASAGWIQGSLGENIDGTNRIECRIK